MSTYRLRQGALTAVVHHESTANPFINFEFINKGLSHVSCVYRNAAGVWHLAPVVLPVEPKNGAEILELATFYLANADVFDNPSPTETVNETSETLS